MNGIGCSFRWRHLRVLSGPDGSSFSLRKALLCAADPGGSGNGSKNMLC